MANSHAIKIAINAKDHATKVLSKVKGTIKGVAGSVFNLKTAFTGLVSAMAIKSVVQSSIDAFISMENSMRGLSSVATKIGEKFQSMGMGMTVDAESAKEAAIELSEDGLMSVADASTALKNLLLAGFGLPEAVDMLKAFKDSAAFGRQGALSFGQAVVSAAEGVKNGNSVLVDNAGITKNLSVMEKEYAESLGKTVSQLSDAEKKQALYNGILEEASSMQGDAAAATETMSGQMSALNTDVFNLYSELGEILAPTIQNFIQQIRGVVAEIRGWISENSKLLTNKFKTWGLEAIRIAKSLGEWLVGGGNGASQFSKSIDTLKQTFDNWYTTLQRIGQWWNDNPTLANMIVGGAGGLAVGGLQGAVVGAGSGLVYSGVRATGLFEPEAYTPSAAVEFGTNVTQEEIDRANAAAAQRRAERPGGLQGAAIGAGSAVVYSGVRSTGLFEPDEFTPSAPVEFGQNVTREEIDKANAAAAQRRIDRPVVRVYEQSIFTGVPQPGLTQ